jgi:C-terminal region of peptidase_M24
MPCITTVMGRWQPARLAGNVFYSAAGSDCTAPPEMLTAEEVRWLDRYHARVAGSLAPLVDPPTLALLERVSINRNRA